VVVVVMMVMTLARRVKSSGGDLKMMTMWTTIS
jgi:hypothetical protein